MPGKIFTFKNKKRLPLWLAWPLALLFRLIFCTCRVKFQEDFQGALRTSPVIFAAWHNRVVIGFGLLPARIRRKMCLLISASRDGEYIATMARLFQFHTARGSSSRGGVGALITLKREIHQGFSPVITVDGPRGPRYCVHPGASALSAMAKIPVVPLCCNYSRCWELKSWDKLQIPKPFSTIYWSMGQEISVDDLSQTEEKSEAIRKELLNITRDPQ